MNHEKYSGLPSCDDWNHAPDMQKATPLVLVLILAISAFVLSLRKEPVAPPATLSEVAATTEKSAPAKPAPTPPSKAESPSVAVKEEPRPWPQAASDIEPDQGAVFGSLDNGLRYVIYPNNDPQKRVSLRLHIAAGSLMEADDQRGLAHFLEHMVFNGTKRYSSAELVPLMQRLGIGFGAHVNAYTSFDETVYMLDLPDLSEETMKICFEVMRDFGDGALLDAAEIDKERGVILSEKISRDSVNYRLMEQQFSKLLPDALLTRRFPIGDENVIKTAGRERFTDLYSRFYTPDRMTFVVVGDISPDEIRKRIETNFASMTRPENSGKNPEMGKIRQPEGLETAVFTDKEVESTEVSLNLIRPYIHEDDTSANRAKKLPLEIANSIIDRRFERIAKEKGSSVAEASASKYELFGFVDLGSISITAADDRWQDAVPVLEKEFRRVIEHGFTEAELAEAKSNLLNAYEQRVKQKASRKSDSIATEIVKTINNPTVFSDPETDLAIVAKCLKSINAAACHQAFKSFWDATGYHLTLTTKSKPENAESELAALFEDSRGTPVEAPATRAMQVFNYLNFGKPGAVATRKEVADLGVTQIALSNKIKINLKRTDFEKGKIRILARIGSGKLTQPKDMPMLDSFVQAIFEGGGLAKHSNDDLQQILAGKNVSTTLVVGDDSFNLSGTTTPADFTTQCQLMCASITDPGYREEALWKFQKAIPMLDQQIKHTPAGPQLEMNGWLHGDDSRYTIAPMKKLESYTIADAKKWLTPELAKGYLELTIVGDFDESVILPDLLSTFGALPARVATAPISLEARKVKFPNAPASKVFSYDSKIEQGTAITVWKTAGIRGNQKEIRRLNLLAEIFGDRLRIEIREKLGASYSPNAGVSGSDALEGMGFIMSESIGKPEDLERLLNTMREQADNIALRGVTADELDRALKPTLAQLEKSSRDNGYWLNTVLAQSQLDPKRLELARTRDADYASITISEVNALAKKYLSAEHAIFVTIKPEVK